MPEQAAERVSGQSVLVLGELLWDCLPGGSVLGGAPANVAYRLNELGASVCLVSRVGADPLGDAAVQQLAARGIVTAALQRDAHYPTGTVAVRLSETGDASYTIHRDVAYDFIEVNEALLAAARAARVLCYGTLAQRAPRTRATLAVVLRAADGAERLVDVNLRQACYAPERVLRTLDDAHIAKLNFSEAREVASWAALPGTDDVQQLCTALRERFSLRVCIMTCGAEGGVACGEAEGVVSWRAAPAQVVDTVGAGDAFTAAFIHARLAGVDLRSACEQGAVLGGRVASTAGGMTPLRGASPSRCEA